MDKMVEKSNTNSKLSLNNSDYINVIEESLVSKKYPAGLATMCFNILRDDLKKLEEYESEKQILQSCGQLLRKKNCYQFDLLWQQGLSIINDSVILERKIIQITNYLC